MAPTIIGRGIGMEIERRNEGRVGSISDTGTIMVAGGVVVTAGLIDLRTYRAHQNAARSSLAARDTARFLSGGEAMRQRLLDAMPTGEGLMSFNAARAVIRLQPHLGL